MECFDARDQVNFNQHIEGVSIHKDMSLIPSVTTRDKHDPSVNV